MVTLRGYRHLPMPSVSVVGSVNLDLVAHAPRLPRPGETITDALFSRHPGGKGANQALAACRMGAEVRLLACVGDDPEADLALHLLREAGVDLAGCRRLAGAPTGVALIVVDAEGENQIVVAPGANRLLTPDHVDVAGADVVICQLEVPVETVLAAVEQATFSIVNAAPARSLPAGLLAAADVVVVNETEREALGDALGAAPLVVTTMGGAGSVAHRRGTEIARVPALPVEVVDTVGAGDAFVGALAVELAAGTGLTAALATANAAGGLAATRHGAQTSLPTRREIEDLVGNR